MFFLRAKSRPSVFKFLSKTEKKTRLYSRRLENIALLVFQSILKTSYWIHRTLKVSSNACLRGLLG